MPSLLSEVHLSPHDTYVLARALVGLDWRDLPCSPLTRLILSHVDLSSPDDLAALRRLLGPEGLRAILSVDPETPLPEDYRSRSGDVNTVPDLPESARLTPEQQEQAAGVGRWLDDYVAWASTAANETPLRFHEGAGLWLGALAISRRLYVHTPWRQRVFPNLYIMSVAVSTYYRKSAGLNLAHDLARAAMPHLILPQPGSPEAFMSMLGGVLPPNFDEIPARDRERLVKGNRYAAQRGILRDELSALFKSFGRDYMSGMKELLMQLYDCPDYLDSNTNNRGLVVIRDAALSILGQPLRRNCPSRSALTTGTTGRWRALCCSRRSRTTRSASPRATRPCHRTWCACCASYTRRCPRRRNGRPSTTDSPLSNPGRWWRRKSGNP